MGSMTLKLPGVKPTALPYGTLIPAAVIAVARILKPIN
jgi:hypothetical protein